MQNQTGRPPGRPRRAGTASVLLASGLIAGLGLSLMPPLPVQAQDKPWLARVQLVGARGGAECPVIVVSLAQSVVILQQIADPSGRALALRLKTDASSPTTASPPETAPSLMIPGVGTALLTLSQDASGPTLTLRLDTAVAGLTATQAGARTILFTLQTSTGAGCTTPQTAGPAPRAAESPGGGDAAPATDAERQADLIAKARADITAGALDPAIELLTQALALPESDQSPIALELLGVTRERNGQLAHARAEYETYLAKYPTGEGADRVRQRLAALTDSGAAPAPLQAADGGPVDSVATGVAGPAPEQPHVTSIPRRNESFPPLGPQPGFRSAGGTTTAEEEEPRSNFEATLSLDYYLNQSSTFITEFDSGTTDSDTELLENSIVLGFSASDSRKIGEATWSWEINGSYDQDLTAAGDSGPRFSRLQTSYQTSAEGPTVTVGRHRIEDFGTLGRIDGASLAYPMADSLTLSVLAGLSVDSSSDALFAGDRLIGGLGATWAEAMPNLDLTVYAEVEKQDGFTDRQAIGFSADYSTDADNVSADIDYDVNFGVLNLARVSWSHVTAARTSYSISAEINHSPDLGLSNALNGQTVDSLSALSGVYTLDQMMGLAQDRTAETHAVSLSWRRPLDKTWQLSINGSMDETLGTPASGGVAATAATGLQYYASVQVLGSNVVQKGDVLSLTGRFADTASSTLFLLDGYWSRPLNTAVKIKPRVQVAHRTMTDGSTEDFVIPSLGVDYAIDRDTALSLEAGVRSSITGAPTYSQESDEAYVTLGLSKSF